MIFCYFLVIDQGQSFKSDSFIIHPDLALKTVHQMMNELGFAHNLPYAVYGHSILGGSYELMYDHADAAATAYDQIFSLTDALETNAQIH